MVLKQVKLGKNVELQYIPFSELIVPWDTCFQSDTESQQNSRNSTEKQRTLPFGTIAPDSLRTLKTLKQSNLDDLKNSIGRFGLLKPFEVAELPEQLDFFFGRGKYVIIDGQRRYFAIKEMLRLPTEQDQRRRKEDMRTFPANSHIEKAETQAQEQLEKLSIRNYVLVPCLVYPYKTYLQMVRHGTEVNKVNDKSLKIFSEIAEEMRLQGISDLNPDDLSNLWETRNTIMGEQQAIEQTLEEIRARKREQTTKI